MATLTGQLRVDRVGDETHLFLESQADGATWDRDEIVSLLARDGVELDEPELLDAAITALAEGAASAAIVRTADGSFSVDVSEDRMFATLCARKPTGGGRGVALEDISAAIVAKGFASLDKARIREGVLAWYRGDALELTELPLCEGKPDEVGVDGDVEWVHPFADGDAADALRGKPRAAGGGARQRQSARQRLHCSRGRGAGDGERRIRRRWCGCGYGRCATRASRSR